jgi:uncharacterized protein
MMAARCARLGDGRLHLQHGPIDVLIECWGERAEIEAACGQASARFHTILDELVAELPGLRAPVDGAYPAFRGSVARRMGAAVWPHRGSYITPMAAVAGSVADELMRALLEGRSLRKACVNDGGDIALHLAPGETIAIGIVDDPTRPRIDADVRVRTEDRTRGVATSGWRGRSQSLGIADAVTVLAHNAAAADAAATLIANAVNADHPSIVRRPARELKEDSDLGELPVTVAVPALPEEDLLKALQTGVAVAMRMKRAGLVEAAYLSLQGRVAAC